MGEHLFGVLAWAVFILKTVFAQVQVSPLYFTHTDLPGGRGKDRPTLPDVCVMIESGVHRL